MKENVKKELEALIQEQKDRIPKLKCEVGAFAYYVYEPSVKERYIKWRENGLNLKMILKKKSMMFRNKLHWR